MAKVTMTLTGMEGLQRALKTAPDLVKAGASDAVQKTGFAVAQRARALVPVVSGDLKKAIGSFGRGTTSRVGVEGARGKQAPATYWRYVEFGTRYRAARPFFKPAADAEADDYVDRLRQVGRDLERDFSSSSLR